MTTQTIPLKTEDGLTLIAAYDEVENPKAALCIVHGFAEHFGRYDDLVARLCTAGYSCYRIDLRGHGRSDGPRGHVFVFNDYLRDFETLRNFVFSRTSAPRFVLSHSNGGLIALHAMARNAEGFSGLVMSSPFFGFSLEVPAWKAYMGRKLSSFLPSLKLSNQLAPKLVSHDPKIQDQYGHDPLVHRVATARWFTETIRAQQEASERAADVKLPILLQLAGDDRIASTPKSRNIFSKCASEDKKVREYEGFFHEIYNEIERDRPISDLIAWLDAHTTNKAEN